MAKRANKKPATNADNLPATIGHNSGDMSHLAAIANNSREMEKRNSAAIRDAIKSLKSLREAFIPALYHMLRHVGSPVKPREGYNSWLNKLYFGLEAEGAHGAMVEIKTMVLNFNAYMIDKNIAEYSPIIFRGKADADGKIPGFIFNPTADAQAGNESVLNETENWTEEQFQAATPGTSKASANKREVTVEGRILSFYRAMLGNKAQADPFGKEAAEALAPIAKRIEAKNKAAAKREAANPETGKEGTPA